MLRSVFGLILAIVMICGAAPQALAHTRSETHSNWRISGRIVRLIFTTPDLEARRLTNTETVSTQRLAAYLQPRVGVRAGAQPCTLQSPPELLSATPGLSRLEFTFQCPSDRKIEVWSSAFFDLVPTHTNFAQIQTSSGDFIEQLITKDHQSLDLDEAGGGALKNADFLKYVQMGVMHIFTGPDHQAFLIGLILLSRRMRDLTFVITGFTLGHSVTLALAVTGLLRPHAEFIDALIGLTIALVGTELVAENTRRPAVLAIATGALLILMAGARLLGVGALPPLLLVGGGLFGACYLMVAGRLRDAAKLRLMVTVVFGLIHGFGFAAGLLEMKLPTANLAQLLFGFNLGFELGQIALVLTVVGLAWVLTRTGLALPRRMVTDVCAAALVGIGLFWFISRSYG